METDRPETDHPELFNNFSKMKSQKFINSVKYLTVTVLQETQDYNERFNQQCQLSLQREVKIKIQE